MGYVYGGNLAAPTARFVYVLNLSLNIYPSPGIISAYSIDNKTGALTPVPGSPFATGFYPLEVAVDPTAKFTYVTNLNSNTVSGYSIDRKTGDLTPVPGSPFATGRFPWSIAITRH
jgi:6-phosphogluconolactonase